MGMLIVWFSCKYMERVHNNQFTISQRRCPYYRTRPWALPRHLNLLPLYRTATFSARVSAVGMLRESAVPMLHPILTWAVCGASQFAPLDPRTTSAPGGLYTTAGYLVHCAATTIAHPRRWGRYRSALRCMRQAHSTIVGLTRPTAPHGSAWVQWLPSSGAYTLETTH